MSRVTVGDIAQVVSGGTPSRSNPEFWGGTIPWVKTGAINYCWITTADEWITKAGLEDSAARVLPKGTILMAMYGQGKTRGQVAILGIDAAINQACAALLLREGCDRSFVYQQLAFRYSSIRKLSNTGSQENLNADLIRSIAFPLPDEAEQKTIGKVLACWDGGASALGGLIGRKGERKRGLMLQLLTGQTRFREFVKSTKQANTRYGCFPADWAAVHIGDVADEISGKNDGGRELPVLSCTKHRGLVNSLEYFGKRIFSADTSNYKVVRRGDFAYATNHIEEGSIGYQDLHEAALISPMYTVFRTRAGVDHSFFFKLVKTELYRHIFEVNTSGSIARRGGLRWDEFAIIKVFLPSVPEQKRIAAVLEVCDREIGLLQKQLEAFKEQKRGLMQKLLTGEVRVKV
jgi:type I restriction enzyme, S subunit